MGVIGRQLRPNIPRVELHKVASCELVQGWHMGSVVNKESKWIWKSFIKVDELRSVAASYAAASRRRFISFHSFDTALLQIRKARAVSGLGKHLSVHVVHLFFFTT